MSAVRPGEPPEGCDLHPGQRRSCPICFEDFWDSMADADDDRA